MKAGDPLPAVRTKVSADRMRTLAHLLHDQNPIHLDRETVRRAGMGDRRINQGPANLAYVMSMLLAAAPGYRIQALKCRFLGVVREDDLVEAAGVVTSVEAGQFSCDAWLMNDGVKVVRVTASLVVR